ncbi:hypothetical protein SAMN04487886_11095 [Clostridium sp. DSM 8431]|nr:hypothetical protein SAMN04487886_11095 [Clostridium sp. DSM 8431]
MNSKHITNYKPKDFAELLGVSVKTLQRWDRENIQKAKRTQLIEDIIPMTRVFRV